MLGRLAQRVLAHRKATAGLLALVVVLALAGAAQIRIDFSSAAFYGDDDADAAALAEFKRVWGADDDVVLVVASTDTEHGFFSRAAVRSAGELAERLESVEGVVDVQSPTRRPIPITLGVRQTLADSFAEGQDSLDPGLRDRVLDSPAVPAWMSRDAAHLSIAVRLAHSSDDVREIAPLLQTIEALLAEASDDTAEFHAAGVPAIRAGFFELTWKDQARFVPLTLLFIGVVLWLLFRRVHAVVVPAVAAGLPTLMLAGTLGWADEPIGLLNQAYFTLLPVIAVADAIHLVSRFHAELREGELDRARLEAAIVTATRRVGLACLLTSLTTAAGFASLGLAEMPVLRSFGIWAAVGVAYAFFSAVVVVPLLLSFVAPHKARVRPPGRALGRVATWATARPATSVGLALAVAWGAAAVVPSVRVDNTLTGLLDDSHPVSRTSRLVDRELGGILTLEVDVPTDAEHADAVGDALVRVSGELQGDPDVRALDPPLIDREAGRARLSIHTADAGAIAFEGLSARVRERLDRHPELAERARLTGTPHLAYRGVNRIAVDLRKSLLVVFLVTSWVIGLLFRSLRVVFVAAFVNGLPLLVGYAALGLAGITMDPLAGVILAMALGIAVDDTIHLLVRHREELEREPDPAVAWRHAVEHSGRAISVTTLVLCGGLAIDLMSSFPPLALLGLLGTLVIALAWVADLLVLPGAWLLLNAPSARSSGPSSSRSRPFARGRGSRSRNSRSHGGPSR